MLRIYLAGPDVFRPAAKAVGQRKQEMCAVVGTLGVFPLDNELDLSHYPRDQDKGHAIAIANETLMRGCDAIIAALPTTPVCRDNNSGGPQLRPPRPQLRWAGKPFLNPKIRKQKVEI